MLDVMRWDPFRGLERLRDELAAAGTGRASAPWAPVSDVIETPDGYVITAELPGVRDEDIEITTRNGVLTVRGERRLEDEVSDDRYHRLERSYGTFERSFRLPEGVAPDGIHAGVAYGVLRVTIPKPSEPESRRIPVTATAAAPAATSAIAASTARCPQANPVRRGSGSS